jgi:hypothetical protein
MASRQHQVIAGLAVLAAVACIVALSTVSRDGVSAEETELLLKSHLRAHEPYSPPSNLYLWWGDTTNHRAPSSGEHLRHLLSMVRHIFIPPIHFSHQSCLDIYKLLSPSPHQPQPPPAPGLLLTRGAVLGIIREISRAVSGVTPCSWATMAWRRSGRRGSGASANVRPTLHVDANALASHFLKEK